MRPVGTLAVGEQIERLSEGAGDVAEGGLGSFQVALGLPGLGSEAVLLRAQKIDRHRVRVVSVEGEADPSVPCPGTLQRRRGAFQLLADVSSAARRKRGEVVCEASVNGPSESLPLPVQQDVSSTFNLEVFNLEGLGASYR